MGITFLETPEGEEIISEIDQLIDEIMGENQKKEEKGAQNEKNGL